MNDYYRDYGNMPFPEDERPGYSLSEKKTLEMLLTAISGEIFAAKYYKNLSDMLIAEDDKRLVHGIMLDEIKHRKLFEEIYANFTGSKPDVTNTAPPPGESETPRGTLPAIFAHRIMDELHDVEFYRQIYFALTNLEYRDVLFEIITDELRHASMMNYLFAKYNK